MRTNNVRSTLLHLFVLLAAIVCAFGATDLFEWLLRGIGYIVFLALIHLMYFLYGFRYGVHTGRAGRNYLSYCLVAGIGILVWFICFLNYAASSEDTSSFLGPEFVWIFSAAYNFPGMYIMNLFNSDRLDNYALVALFLLNFYPSTIFWLGLQTRVKLKGA
ncbi:hypothetical protein E5161_00195 [Cohnella pontilimi]|uniref:Uncharacterized protein n=1 Tax=Cohnella pontilimi TaxID=2564100 RepID=A0A4V5LSQ8_9BACL|nr:hypothetical protein [Cohnella pontilimi]TJY43869.1 hypothetical protein E5161_00195 [Cohnella pontilimi]